MKSASKHTFILCGLLALTLLLIAFAAPLRSLVSSWSREEYSHGYLIPFIAAFIAWHKLSDIKPSLRSSWIGAICLVIALIMNALSRLSAFDTIGQYGLLLGFVSLSLAFFGTVATRTIAPALIYLIFAIPLPHLVQANLSAKLQLISSSLGVWPLDLLDIPVYQEGNIIDLGGYKLQVVDACSGLRYLFPLMSFGFLIAFLLKDKFWKRVVLFLSTIPITIGMNSLRIAFIGITVDIWGRAMAEGFIHVFEGWVIFLACVIILLGETWVLLRIGKGGSFRYEYLSLPCGGPKAPAGSQKPLAAALVLTVVAAITFNMSWNSNSSGVVPARESLASFPLQLGNWQGQADHIDMDTAQFLQFSDYWIANYRRPDDQTYVNFYTAYYASQRADAQTHSPSLCIPGGGWQIADSHVETLTLPNGTPVKFSRLLIRKGDQAQIVYYWFDERGRDLTESYMAKWYLLWDSIAMHRTDGALVRLVTNLSPGENETAAENRLHDFLTAVYPELGRFIPGR